MGVTCKHTSQVSKSYENAEGGGDYSSGSDDTAMKVELPMKAPKMEIKAPKIEIKAPKMEVKAPKMEIKAPKMEMKSPTLELVYWGEQVAAAYGTAGPLSGTWALLSLLHST